MNPNRHAAAVPWTYAAELLTNLNRLDVYVTGTGTGSRSPSVSVTQETVMLMDSVDGRLDLLVLGPGDSEGAHPQTLLESEVGSGSDGDDGTCHRLQPLGNDSFVLSLGLDQGGPEGDHPRGNSLFGGPLRLSDTVAPGKTELDPRSFAQGLACRACSLQLAGAPKQLFSQPSRYWQEWAAELWFCHATPGAQMAAESAVAAASNLITPSSGTWLVGPTELCIPVADLVSPPRDVFQRTLRCDRCQAALGSPVLPPDEAEAGAASPAIGFWKHAVRALPAEDLYKSFGVEQFAARSLVAATEGLVSSHRFRILADLEGEVGDESKDGNDRPAVDLVVLNWNSRMAFGRLFDSQTDPDVGSGNSLRWIDVIKVVWICQDAISEQDRAPDHTITLPLELFQQLRAALEENQRLLSAAQRESVLNLFPMAWVPPPSSSLSSVLPPDKQAGATAAAVSSLSFLRL